MLKNKPMTRSGLHALWWLCLLMGFVCLCCSPTYFEGRISRDTLDPNKRPCLASRECNNLSYAGRCINQVCQSTPRRDCDVTGQERTCTIALQQGLCAQGTQRCQPPPFAVRVWGDCLLRQTSGSQPCAQAACQQGEVRDCYTSERGCRIDDKGRFLCFSPCKTGVQLCQGSKWGKCVGAQGPITEVCNGKDDDCDGKIDANADGEVLSRPCYTGPTSTRIKGVCHFGMSICDNGEWSTCFGEQAPSKETCNTKDDDCNGTIDDNACEPDHYCDGNRCIKNAPNEQSADGGSVADAGPIQDSGTFDQGIPETSSEPAPQDQSGQDIGPTPDFPSQDQGTTDGGVSDNGSPDNGPQDQGKPDMPPPECSPGESRSCYSGKPGTHWRAGCRAGTQQCTQGKWGPCQGEILPKPETCDGRDNDCDGRIDRTSTNGLLVRKCYTGPPNTRGKGLCREGIQLCEQSRWGRCIGQIVPKAEICNERDDDCNGKIDDAMSCN